MVNSLFLMVLFCIFNLQNGVSLVCLSESSIYFKNWIFVFLILFYLWWHTDVGHPIRMEWNAFPTKWRRNTVFPYLSIFNGEYLWIHLVQQGRLILKQTGIFTSGVSNAFLQFFSVFCDSFYSTYLSSKSFVWRTALSFIPLFQLEFIVRS